MEYRVVGGTGMHVSTVCLGTVMFGSWGTADADASARIVHEAIDAGVNLIDTADAYAGGESEEIVGRALKGGLRDRVVLSSKFGLPVAGTRDVESQAAMRRSDPNNAGASRRYVARAVEASLRRLDTDWLDICYVHRPDPWTDIDETLGALTDLIHAGKVRAIGCSSYQAHDIVEAQWVSRTRGRERFSCEELAYSLVVRSAEADALPVCERYGMGVLVFSALDAGWLSGKYRLGTEMPPMSKRAALNSARFATEAPEYQRKLEAIEQLAQLAEEAGMTLIELAVAFVLRHSAITSVVAGIGRSGQLDAYVQGAGRVLGEDVLDRIDEIVEPGTSFHHRDLQAAPIPALEDPARRRRPPAREARAAVGAGA